YWPSKINSLLTLLTFILTTTDNTATLKITTNNIPFKNLVEHTIAIHHISHLKLDRLQFLYLQRLLMAMLMERKREISYNPNLKISDPSPPYPLDTIPQDFLYNRFSTLINDIPTIYPIKTLLKRIHQITNDISWHNQQRIQLWESYLKDIDWDITLETLIFNDKPKALYTNPTLSNIKNFKIKLIAEELPTHLLLHLRNPKKYPNHFCPRCYSTSEDYSHLITCVSNHFTFNTELRRLLLKIAKEKKLALENPEEFISNYTYLHINKKVPIGIITGQTLAPFTSQHHKKKLSPLLHHRIAKLIYKEIWIPSRMSRHSEAVPPPPPLTPPIMIKTPPPIPTFIKQKIDKFILSNNFSLNNIFSEN